MEYTSTIIMVLSVVVLIAALLNPLPSLGDASTGPDHDDPSDLENRIL